MHCCCVESFRIRSSSGPYFPSFRRNMGIYKVNIIFSRKERKYGPEKLLIRTLFEQCHTSAKFEMQSNKWEHWFYIFNEATHYFSTPNITTIVIYFSDFQYPVVRITASNYVCGFFRTLMFVYKDRIVKTLVRENP